MSKRSERRRAEREAMRSAARRAQHEQTRAELAAVVRLAEAGDPMAVALVEELLDRVNRDTGAPDVELAVGVPAGWSVVEAEALPEGLGYLADRAGRLGGWVVTDGRDYRVTVPVGRLL